MINFIKLDKLYDFGDSSIKKFKILRGLVLSSVCFDGSKKKYIKNLDLVKKEILNNFNEEGVHLSRLPSTQLSILGDLITIRDIIMAAKIDVPEYLSSQIKKSAVALLRSSIKKSY